jgi:hypothetical protein
MLYNSTVLMMWWWEVLCTCTAIWCHLSVHDPCRRDYTREAICTAIHSDTELYPAVQSSTSPLTTKSAVQRLYHPSLLVEMADLWIDRLAIPAYLQASMPGISTLPLNTSAVQILYHHFWFRCQTFHSTVLPFLPLLPALPSLPTFRHLCQASTHCAPALAWCLTRPL